MQTLFRDNDVAHASRPAVCGNEGAVSPRRSPVETSGKGLPHTSFETIGSGKRQAQEAFVAHLNGIVDVEFCAPFSARAESWRIGPLSSTSLNATAHRVVRTAAQIARDSYDAIHLHYVVAGRAAGSAAGRTLTSAPGDLIVIDYKQPFAITGLGVRDTIEVVIPRVLFPAGQRGPTHWHGASLSGGGASLLGGFMAQLAAQAHAVSTSSGTFLADALLALLGASLAEARSAAKEPGSRLVGRAEHLVDSRLASPDLGPRWLWTQLGVSRSELYTALERFGGVARFIMQRRLAAAKAALRDPEERRRIREIAFDLGFSSEAHFARAFRAAFGMTASTMRRQAVSPRADLAGALP